MKSRSKQFASNRSTAFAALFTAVVLALFAFALSSSSIQNAYADEDAAEGAEEKTVELSTTPLDSKSGVTDDYKTFLEADDLEKSLSKKKVTISEVTNDDGRFIDIVASEDTPMSIVLVEMAGSSYLESALPKDTLKADVHYLMPIGADAKLTSIELYQDKDVKDTDDSDSKESKQSEDNDSLAPAADTEDPNNESGEGTGDGDEELDGAGDTNDNTDQNDNANQNDTNQDGDTTEGTDDNTNENADGDNDTATNNEDNANTDSTENENVETQADENTDNETNENADDSKKDSSNATTDTTKDSTSSETKKTSSTYSISIGKVDNKTGAALKGAEFQLKNPDGGSVATWTTTTDSYHQIEGLSKDVTYVLEETRAPEGYNRERNINIKFDSSSGKVLIDQGGSPVELGTNSSGIAELTVKDMKGSSPIKTSVSTSPKTGDTLKLGGTVAALAVIVVVSALVANKARKKRNAA